MCIALEISGSIDELHDMTKNHALQSMEMCEYSIIVHSFNVYGLDGAEGILVAPEASWQHCCHTMPDVGHLLSGNIVYSSARNDSTACGETLLSMLVSYAGAVLILLRYSSRHLLGMRCVCDAAGAGDRSSVRRLFRSSTPRCRHSRVFAGTNACCCMWHPNLLVCHLARFLP